MEYAEDPSELDADKIKHELKIRRELVQIVLGDINMLSRLLEKKIGKIAFLSYMAEISQTSSGDIFGERTSNSGVPQPPHSDGAC